LALNGCRKQTDWPFRSVVEPESQTLEAVAYESKNSFRFEIFHLLSPEGVGFFADFDA